MSGSERRDVALILAAGRGTRMGGPKALMIVEGKPWWRVQQDRLASAGVSAVWVVSAEVDAALRESTLRRVIADPLLPMFSSVVSGIRAIADDEPGGVFVLPVDVPAPGRGVWESLARGADEPTIPMHGGRRGHPIRLPWGFIITHILPRSDDAAWVERTRLDDLVRGCSRGIEVSDGDVGCDLDSRADVDRWTRERTP